MIGAMIGAMASLWLSAATTTPWTHILRTDVPHCALSWVKAADKTGAPACAPSSLAVCEVQPLMVDGRVEAYLLQAHAPLGQCAALARFAPLGVGPPYGFAVGGEGLHQTLVNNTAQAQAHSGQWIFEGGNPVAMPPLVARPPPLRTAATSASTSHHRLPLSLDARFLGVEGQVLARVLDGALHAAAPAVSTASPCRVSMVDGRPVVEIDAAWPIDVVRQALFSARDRPPPPAAMARVWASARTAIALVDMPVGQQAKRRAQQWWWTGSPPPTQRLFTASVPVTDDDTLLWLRAHLNPDALVPNRR